MNRVVFEKLNIILVGMCVHWRSSWRERERERWELKEFNDSLFIFRKEL